MVQARLEVTTSDLHTAESRLAELERLPGFRMFVTVSGAVQTSFSWLYKVTVYRCTVYSVQVYSVQCTVP